ncbi:response regulator [Pigmentibacter ruber]|uniref:response regulator n=1 Tax=Pigmentibacter ruber TaxID=2683196 RepID=UPI00131EAB1B|nr:response regulator [Pigmentibacter ruber]BFD33187.1 hypothetical protein GTC16762_28050 [Pigmentibacter ruber]
MVGNENIVKKKILIVEDEAILAKNLEDILTDLNYQVVGIADNSMKAIMQFFMHNPDLILMDIHLKGQDDGIKTAEIILEQKLVPIIFITANQDAATFNRAKMNGAYGYVLKPFQERELQIVIEIAFSQFEDKIKILKLENLISNVERLNAVDTFASGFIHAINTSLTQIFMAYNTLKNEQVLSTNLNVITALNLIDSASNSIKSTVKNYNHLLDSLELDAPSSFTIFEGCKEALDICKYYALSKKVLIRELKGSKQIHIYTSRSVLFLSLVNVLKTICDFIQNQSDSWIEINWEENTAKDERLIKLSFSGELLDSEVIENIFNPHSENNDKIKLNKFALVTTKNLLEKCNSDLFLEIDKEVNCFVIKVKIQQKN